MNGKKTVRQVTKLPFRFQSQNFESAETTR
jgi:hypothetical protein